MATARKSASKGKESKRPFSCRLPADILDTIQGISEKTGISQSRLVENAVRLLADNPSVQNLMKAADEFMQLERDVRSESRQGARKRTKQAELGA